MKQMPYLLCLGYHISDKVCLTIQRSSVGHSGRLLVEFRI